MGFFGILIIIGIIGLLFSGIGGGFWHRRRFGNFRPFGFFGHRPPPPREPFRGTREPRGPEMHRRPMGHEGPRMHR